MSTTRPAKKLSAVVSVMAFELASAPITKKLDAAEEKNTEILAAMTAAVKRGAGAAEVADLDAAYDAINVVIEALQEKLFELEAALPGLPAVEAMNAEAA